MIWKRNLENLYFKRIVCLWIEEINFVIIFLKKDFLVVGCICFYFKLLGVRDLVVGVVIGNEEVRLMRNRVWLVWYEFKRISYIYVFDKVIWLVLMWVWRMSLIVIGIKKDSFFGLDIFSDNFGE